MSNCLTQSESRTARPCDDILSLIGLNVETRRSMDKVIGHLNEVSEYSGNGLGWDGLYYHFQDEGWWMDMRFKNFCPLTPKWLSDLPDHDASRRASELGVGWVDVYE